MAAGSVISDWRMTFRCRTSGLLADKIPEIYGQPIADLAVLTMMLALMSCIGATALGIDVELLIRLQAGGQLFMRNRRSLLNQEGVSTHHMPGFYTVGWRCVYFSMNCAICHSQSGYMPQMVPGKITIPQ